MGGLADNTTPHLVEDIERLRAHLGVERWLLFGGSWGSTLALAYAQTYPGAREGLRAARHLPGPPVRGGLVPARPGRRVPRRARPTSPRFLPEQERNDLLGAYLRRLTDPDPAVHMPAARAWSIYEGTCSTLLPSPDTITTFAQDRTALGLARIEAHYFANDLFLPPGGLLGAHGPDRRSIPAEIVQGRYDMICPATHRVRPWRARGAAARLSVVPDAGHSALEPGIRRALVTAVERFRHRPLATAPNEG